MPYVQVDAFTHGIEAQMELPDDDVGQRAAEACRRRGFKVTETALPHIPIRPLELSKWPENQLDETKVTPTNG
jgi:hypothetical protein